jgi:poly-gamma-glutamate synthesis protein (capsule biosynthesis protein)
MSGFTLSTDDFSLVATGDSLIFQRVSVFKEPGFLKVRKLIRGADAAFNNFETIIPAGMGYPRYKRDPTAWMTSPPYVLNELVWMGFNIFSLANNHSMDYSAGALLETKRRFDEASIPNAGTGSNLAEARAPAYLNTEKGRVALIAVNTGDTDGLAGYARETVQGRPGLNPLRYDTTYILPEAEFQQLTKIAEKLGLPDPSDDALNFLGSRFQLGDEADIVTKPHGPDVEGNLNSVREARRNADYVLVSIHNHIKRRPGEHYFDDTIEHLSGFVEIFSKAAVDAGADAVLGHGHHCLNGIEVHRGKPIFYGLGNFITQSYSANPKPYDWYEARGFHTERFPDESDVLHPDLGGEAERRKIRRQTTSVVARIEFSGGEPTRLLLHPLEMPRDHVQGGRPLMAEGDSAAEILGRLSKLSSEYGTEIKIDGETGVVTL